MENWTGANPFLGMNNPFLQSNIDATLGDITRNYNLAVKPQTESAMVRSGSFGNSGLMQMQGEQQRQLADTLGKTASNMRMNDYRDQMGMFQWDQQFNKGLFDTAFNQNQVNLGNVTGLLGMMDQFNKGDVAASTTMQNTLLDYLKQFSDIAVGNGRMGTTSSGTQSMPGSPLMGAIGGWGLGGQIGKTIGG